MPEPVRRLPYVLLGLMTIATFLGPIVIVVVLRGGSIQGWPPDRPVEWVTFWGICALVAVLMIACLGVSLKIQSKIARSNSEKNQDSSGEGPRVSS